ncbi:hypothetical protein EIN_248760 [Entamoeba invadens IP1]|uniref:Rho-GAP domain-containing protein n=1 Tax=Entamoeba invadens IP1 TaxID=370355 RepID=A0A0A1UH81_ENTIV|nr:hypothetical protein EIN_248760 [Entamoeba invadens IP1]ELP94862.1 hypothetical protein EIN_248760 [Entamoeba invadens IP1]|eukprot:XP_004261633.1 hypothetical protein EIN_248760 [Entamoeba invadens IP1]
MSKKKETILVIQSGWKKPKELSITYSLDPQYPTITLDGSHIMLKRSFMSFTLSEELTKELSKDNVLTSDEQNNSFELIYDREIGFLCQNELEFIQIITMLSPLVRPIGVFRFPINSTITKSRWTVPNIVYRSIEFLRANNASNTEGIFRKNGNSKRVSELRALAETDSDIQFDKKESTDVVATLLKKYLASLVETVIPSFWVNDFINMPLGAPLPFNFVNSLPKPNRNTLCYICMYLDEIVKNSDVNKMDAQNTATCMALALTRRPIDSKLDELKFTNGAIAGLKCLLEQSESAFKDVVEEMKTWGNPPEYPAFQSRPPTPFNLIALGIKTEIKAYKKQQRLSSSLMKKMVQPQVALAEKNNERRKRRNFSVSFDSFGGAFRKDEEKKEEVVIEKHAKKVLTPSLTGQTTYPGKTPPLILVQTTKKEENKV